MIEGSRSGSGFIPLTNGSGSRRHKNMWTRIRNTAPSHPYLCWMCCRASLMCRKTDQEKLRRHGSAMSLTSTTYSSSSAKLKSQVTMLYSSLVDLWHSIRIRIRGPYNWLTDLDQDPALFVSDLQEIKITKQTFLLIFEGTFFIYIRIQQKVWIRNTALEPGTVRQIPDTFLISS